MTEWVEAALSILTHSYRYAKTFDKNDPERLARAAVSQARAHHYTLPQAQTTTKQPFGPAPSKPATEPGIHSARCPSYSTPNTSGSLLSGDRGRRLKPGGGSSTRR
jgi:hypothetical protein